jgi:hypothetical protein
MLTEAIMNPRFPVDPDMVLTLWTSQHTTADPKTPTQFNVLACSIAALPSLLIREAIEHMMIPGASILPGYTHSPPETPEASAAH